MQRLSDKEIACARANNLTTQRLVSKLEAQGAVLLDPPLGAGKTHLVQRVITEHLASDHPGLVIYLCGRVDLLEEQPAFNVWKTGAGPGTGDIGALVRRPEDLCASVDRDAPWLPLERAGLGRYGRDTLCATCPVRKSCRWPNQFTKDELAGKRVILATTAYLDVIPTLPYLLARLTGRELRFVIFDEAALITSSFRTVISRSDIEIFTDTLRSYSVSKPERWVSAWVDFLDLILAGYLDPLDAPPFVREHCARELQRLGVDRHGGRYRYLADELRSLPFRRPRWVTRTGDVGYVRRPLLGRVPYIFLSAKMRLDVAQDRLGDQRLVRAFPGLDFIHEDTRIYNIRIKQASARNFKHNRAQIMDFAAGLVAKNIAADRSTVILSKLTFVPDVMVALPAALKDVYGVTVTCVPFESAPTTPNPNVIPVIHFGLSGSNRLENYDWIVAVNAYNLSERALNAMLNDVRHPDDEVRVEIRNQGADGARLASTYRMGLKPQEDARAQAYLEMFEGGVVEQAIGRVRFATRPRTVVVMQGGPISYTYDKEFLTLDEARTHFGIQARRQHRRSAHVEQVAELRAQGLTNGEIATALSVSVRTIQRAGRG